MREPFERENVCVANQAGERSKLQIAHFGDAVVGVGGLIGGEGEKQLQRNGVQNEADGLYQKQLERMQKEGTEGKSVERVAD